MLIIKLCYNIYFSSIGQKKMFSLIYVYVILIHLTIYISIEFNWKYIITNGFVIRNYFYFYRDWNNQLMNCWCQFQSHDLVFIIPEEGLINSIFTGVVNKLFKQYKNEKLKTTKYKKIVLHIKCTNKISAPLPPSPPCNSKRVSEDQTFYSMQSAQH